MNIIEIHKTKFLEDFDSKSFNKLFIYTRKKPEIFNLDFFTKATIKAENSKNLIGLIYIAHLYKALDHLIEAEYVLSKAYNINKNDKMIIYNLIDIYCSRQNVQYANHFVLELTKTGDQLLILKSKIKYALISGIYGNTISNLYNNFNKYENNQEFIYLILDIIDRKNDPVLAKLVFTSSQRLNISDSLTDRWKNKYKKILIQGLIDTLLRIKDGL